MSDMFMKMVQTPRSAAFSEDEMMVMARAEAILRDGQEGRLPRRAYGVLFAAEAARIENETRIGRFAAGVRVADGKIEALEARLGRATDRGANAWPVMSFAYQLHGKVAGFLLARRRAVLRREVAEFVTDRSALQTLLQADPELGQRVENMALAGVRDIAAGDLGRGGGPGDYGSLVRRYVEGMISAQPREAAWAASARAQLVRAFVEEPAALSRLAATATPDLVKVLRHDIALVTGQGGADQAAQVFKDQLLKRDASVSAGDHYVALREQLAAEGRKGLEGIGGIAGLRGFEMALGELARDAARGAEDLVNVSVRHPKWAGVLIADAQVAGADERAAAPVVENSAPAKVADNTIAFPIRQPATELEAPAPYRVTRGSEMPGFVQKANAERGAALMLPTSDVSLAPEIVRALKRDAQPALDDAALMGSIQKTAADAGVTRAQAAMTDQDKAAHDRLEIGRRVLVQEAVDRGIMEKQAAEKAKMTMLSKHGQKIAKSMEGDEAARAPIAASRQAPAQAPSLAHAARNGSQVGSRLARGVAQTLG